MMKDDDVLKRKANEEAEVQEQSYFRKRQRSQSSDSSFLQHITLSPRPDGLIARDDFMATFQRYQIAYIPNAKELLASKDSEKSDNSGRITVSDIFDIFQNAAKEDRDTWTQETWVANDTNERMDTPGNFLKDDCKHQRGYCSFILQHDKQQVETVLQNLPFADLPVASAPSNADAQQDQQPWKVAYGPGLWIFFGRNLDGTQALQGRVEHTDSIQHDGTWHYQLSGVKEWHVRPTATLLESILGKKNEGDKSNEGIFSTWKEERDRGEKDDCIRITIRCQEGDILVVNTRLWWHSTTLSVQPTVSLSYARDMYLNSNTSSDANPASMSNVDGLYAANDIEAGTIIFREGEMPDCELHRAKENANCEVVELENGEGAIVSSRRIKSGEFFCILESDEYEDDEEEDYEEEEVDEDN